LEHTSMALSRTDISDGLIDELHGFERMVRSLMSVRESAMLVCSNP
jgi:thiamine monophosphate kinase